MGFIGKTRDSAFTDAKGKNALDYVIEKNHEAVFNALVQYYSSPLPNLPFLESALLLAARLGNIQYVERAITSGARGDKHSLSYAALSGDTACVLFFLQKGYNPNFQNAGGSTPLMLVAAAGNLACVNTLLEHNADVVLVDSKGKNALEYAKNHPAILQRLKEVFEAKQNSFDGLLVAIMKNPDLPVHPLIKECDEQGNTLLMRAINLGNKPAVVWCLRNGIDIHQTNGDGLTALTLAAYRGSKALTKQLLKLGARPFAYSRDGKLVCCSKAAAMSGNEEVLQMILEHPFEKPFTVGNVPFGDVAKIEALAGAVKGKHIPLVEKLLQQNVPMHSPQYNALADAVRIKSKSMTKFLLQYIKQNYRTPDALERKLETVLLSSVPLTNKLFGVVACIHAESEGRFRDMERRYARIYESNPKQELIRRLGEAALKKSSQPAQPIQAEIAEMERVRLYDLLQENNTGIYLRDPRGALASFKQHVAGNKIDCAQLEKEAHTSLLMLACIFGHKHIVDELTRMGLPAEYFELRDGYGRTALMYALLYGNTDCALALIQSPHDRYGKPVIKNGHAIPVNLCRDSIYLFDQDKRSALFYALYATQYDESCVVVEKGENVRLNRDQYSARYGANQVIDKLLKMGVEFAPTAQIAENALRLAAEFGDMQVLWKVMRRCTLFQKALIRQLPTGPVKEKIKE